MISIQSCDFNLVTSEVVVGMLDTRPPAMFKVWQNLRAYSKNSCLITEGSKNQMMYWHLPKCAVKEYLPIWINSQSIYSGKPNIDTEIYFTDIGNTTLELLCFDSERFCLEAIVEHTWKKTMNIDGQISAWTSESRHGHPSRSKTIGRLTNIYLLDVNVDGLLFETN